MIYFVIILTIIIGISFIAWYTNRQDTIPDTPVRPLLNGVNKINNRPIREEFLDNYIWICDLFGVGTDIRAIGLEKVKSSDKDFDIFFIDCVCNYQGHYPKNLQKPQTEVSWKLYEKGGFIKFMKEFNNIVLQYRKDGNTINEIKELGISPADYLKPVNKHKPRPIDIQ